MCVCVCTLKTTQDTAAAAMMFGLFVVLTHKKTFRILKWKKIDR